MNILAITGVIALTVGLLSFPGANAEENSKGKNENSSKSSNDSESNNSSQEFKGSAIRSHGHPIANMADAPAAGSKQDQKSYVNNDDESSEIEWQKWNKANAKATAKALGSAAANPIIYHAGGPLNVYSGAVQIIPVWVGN